MNSERVFEKYYMDYKKNIYWYVRRRVSSDEIAQDITADVFVKLIENDGVLSKRDCNGVKAWLFTVARNMIIDFFRKKSTNVEKFDIDDEVLELVAVEDGDHLAHEIKDEQKQLLLGAMDGLKSVEKEILSLRFQEEYSFAEIAEITGKKEGNVKMILYRALEKLNGMLTKK